MSGLVVVAIQFNGFTVFARVKAFFINTDTNTGLDYNYAHLHLLEQVDQICARWTHEAVHQVDQIVHAPVSGKQDAHEDELVFHVTALNTADNAPQHQLIDVRLTDSKPKRAVTRRGNLPRESVAVLKQWCE